MIYWLDLQLPLMRALFIATLIAIIISPIKQCWINQNRISLSLIIHIVLVITLIFYETSMRDYCHRWNYIYATVSFPFINFEKQLKNIRDTQHKYFKLQQYILLNLSRIYDKWRRFRNFLDNVRNGIWLMHFRESIWHGIKTTSFVSRNARERETAWESNLNPNTHMQIESGDEQRSPDSRSSKGETLYQIMCAVVMRDTRKFLEQVTCCSVNRNII